ncbi:MAG: hypothetical protein WBB42_17185 [Polyangiales bacterium]
MNLDNTPNQLLSLAAQAKQGLITALPNLLTAAIVLILGWGLAWTLRRVVRRLFRRLAVQIPPGTTRAAWNEAVDDQGAGNVAASGVYWLILLTTLMVAIDALGIPVFSRWIGGFAGHLPRLALAVVLVFGGIVAGRLARNAIIKTAIRMPASQARGLARFAQLSIVVATALIAAGQLGLDVSLLSAVFVILLAAALAAAALAFGLGAREVVADILAMHYVNKSYRIGQVVRLGSDEGRIVRTTRTAVFLESADGEISIPGRDFADSRCVLLSQEDPRGT